MAESSAASMGKNLRAQNPAGVLPALEFGREAACCVVVDFSPDQRRAAQSHFDLLGQTRHDDVGDGAFFEEREQCLIEKTQDGAITREADESQHGMQHLVKTQPVTVSKARGSGDDREQERGEGVGQRDGDGRLVGEGHCLRTLPKNHGLPNIRRVTMLRMRLRLYSVVLGLAFTVSVFGELNAQTTTLEKVTEELLGESVEAPDWQEYLRARLKEGWVPPPLPDHTPRDDAPIAELIDHWQVREWDVGRTPKPSERVSELLLKYCENNPASFNSFRWYFEPKHKDVIERVQRLFAKLPADVSAEEHQSIENWLMLKANALPDLLRKRATEAFDHPADSSKHEALNFLMLHDWPAAEAMLQRFARSDQAGARGLALISLYQHSLSDAAFAKDRERIRAELQKFVEGQEAPDVRANALEALNEPDWPGRAEWILDRFKDEALSKVERPTTSFGSHTSVFCNIVKRAPDFWVPKVIPLVGSANRTEHNNAVDCLVQFHLEDTREDALRPLLPWLSNPAWATSMDEDGRWRLIQSLNRFSAPESVPGLIWVLEHGQGYELKSAAEALIYQNAKESVPALKKALVKESDKHHRRAIIQALLKFNGLTMEEKADALVAYVKEGRAEMMRPVDPFAERTRLLPTEVSIGEAMCFAEERDDKLVKLLQQRAKNISTKQPLVAQKIREIIGGWNTDSSMAQTIEQLRSGALTKETVQMLLSDRSRFAKPLAAVSELKGGAQVIQALVTTDQKRVNEILRGNDSAMQAFLCVCARLDRTPLPIPDVANLLSVKNTLLVRAAESYLECADSVESRTRLLEHRQGEAYILGAMDGVYSKPFSGYGFGALEADLRKRVLMKDGPDEVYALLSVGGLNDNGQCVVETRGDHALLVNEQWAERYGTRDLTETELQTLRQFLKAHQTDDLPALNLSVCDGIQYEYLRLTKDGGRRLFMNNPGSYRRSMGMPGWPTMIKKGDPDDTVYAALVDQFHSLTHDASKFSVRYHAQKQLPDLHILMPRETAEIRAVMQDHDQLIVSAQSPDESKARWRVFKDGQLGADSVAGPMMKLPERGGLPKGFIFDDNVMRELWHASLDEGLVLPATDAEGEEALWIANDGHAPKLLAKGRFWLPLSTLDKHWIIAAKIIGGSSEESDILVRIDAKTGAESKIQFEPANILSPIALLPSTGKILVHRASDPPYATSRKSVGPKRPEHWLLEAETGAIERVSGEFGPLHDQSWRPLQPTAQPHVVWAALSLSDKNSITTQVGRYDLQKFKFDPVLTLPGLRFNSMDIWIDEKARLIYITVNGDLLSLSLPADKSRSK